MARSCSLSRVGNGGGKLSCLLQHRADSGTGSQKAFGLCAVPSRGRWCPQSTFGPFGKRLQKELGLRGPPGVSFGPVGKRLQKELHLRGPPGGSLGPAGKRLQKELDLRGPPGGSLGPVGKRLQNELDLRGPPGGSFGLEIF